MMTTMEFRCANSGLPQNRFRTTRISQCCLTYQLHFPPKRSKWRAQNPKSEWPGKFLEIQFQDIHFGDLMLVIWVDLLRDMRMAKADMLGRGDEFLSEFTPIGDERMSAGHTGHASIKLHNVRKRKQG